MAAANARIVNYYKALLAVCLVFSVPVFFLAMIAPQIPSLAGGGLMDPLVGELSLHGLLLWILVTPVQFGVGSIFYKSAWSGLCHGSANMSLLVTLGTSAAYGYSLLDVILLMTKEPAAGMMDGMVMDGMVMEDKGMGGGTHFFETSSTLITFVVLGRLLESYAKGKTSQALTELMSLQPSEAVLVYFLFFFVFYI